MKNVSRQCCYYIVGLAFFLCLLANISHGETITTFSLTNEYRFRLGDNPSWVEVGFDDSKWKPIEVPGGWRKQGFNNRPYIGWYRTKFQLPDSFESRQPALLIGPVRSAYEIYLNGKLIGRVGKIDQYAMWSQSLRQRVFAIPVGRLNHSSSNLLAIRVQRMVTDGGIRSGTIIIGNEDTLRLQYENRFRQTLAWESAFLIFYGSTFLFSTILYTLGFRDKKHFWFAIVILQIGLSHFLKSNIFENSGGMNVFTNAVSILIEQLFPLSTLLFLKYALHTTIGKFLRIMVCFYVVCCAAWWINIETINLLYLWWALGSILLFVPVAMFWCSQAIRHKRPDGWPLLIGIIGLVVIFGMDVFASLYTLSNDREYVDRWLYVPIDWYAWLCVHLSMIYILAAGYERTRRLLHQSSQQILQAQEDERRRIARDLHDGIGQSLLAIKLQLDVMGGQIDEGVLVESDQLQRASSDADAVIDEVRRVASDLQPDILSRVGLVEAVRNFVNMLQQRMEIIIDINVRSSIDENLIGSAHLYRIVQEGVHNAIRHGESKKIKITFEQQKNMFCMKIEDDGQGFDIDAESQGVGLTSMRERAALIGGKIEIQSQKPKGTTIALEVPLS